MKYEKYQFIGYRLFAQEKQIKELIDDSLCRFSTNHEGWRSSLFTDDCLLKKYGDNIKLAGKVPYLQHLEQRWKKIVEGLTKMHKAGEERDTNDKKHQKSEQDETSLLSNE